MIKRLFLFTPTQRFTAIKRLDYKKNHLTVNKETQNKNMCMKKSLLSGSVIIGIVLLFMFCNSFRSKEAAISKTGGDSLGFAVVELFTSEGCSSCPPADAAIAALLEQKLANVYILSYHVDYWDRLGWKDEFSQAAFSGRQRQYAKYLSLDGVYTPQVIVNGTEQFVGSNTGKLQQAVNNGLHNEEKTGLKISADSNHNVVLINYEITGKNEVLLNTVLALPESTTKVKRGENEGRTLRHVNIVSSLQVGAVKGSGKLTINVPAELQGHSFKLIAYAQDKNSFKVVGAQEVDF